MEALWEAINRIPMTGLLYGLEHPVDLIAGQALIEPTCTS